MIYGHNMKPPEIAVAKNIPKNVVEDKLAVYMQQWLRNLIKEIIILKAPSRKISGHL